MGFVSDLASSGDADILGLGGSQAAQASLAGAELQAASGQQAIEEERRARTQAQKFFKPFAGAARRGVKASKFLANPQAQFNFLQNNPLFDLALQNANQQTQQSAAASGRLSAGDTLEQLSNNVLLSAQPLIDRQRQDVNNLLSLGTGIAQSQGNIAIGQGSNVGNLLTDIGAAQAAGGVGAANAQTAGNQNLAQIGVAAASAFSDERLKTNKRKIGSYKGYNLYSWDWNLLARMLYGLIGSSIGLMSREVQKVNPSAVIVRDDGYNMVKYGEV